MYECIIQVNVIKRASYMYIEATHIYIPSYHSAISHILSRSEYEKAEVAGLRSGPGGPVQLALEAVVVEAELGQGQGQGAVLGYL